MCQNPPPLPSQAGISNVSDRCTHVLKKQFLSETILHVAVFELFETEITLPSLHISVYVLSTLSDIC